MTTARELFLRFGPPEEENNMGVLVIPASLYLHHVPRRIYCNKDIHKPLLEALTAIAKSGQQDAIKTWDGCFNIRKKVASSSRSLHSWGYAVDINAAWNRYGAKPTMPGVVVNCFKIAGFEWGGDWKPGCCDGMHFELRRIPMDADKRASISET
jgi:hypothetical protein